MLEEAVWAIASGAPGGPNPVFCFANGGAVWRAEFWTALRHSRGRDFFIGQTIALLVELAKIPLIEPGTMETERKMTIAAAWHADATAALAAPEPGDR